MKMEKVYFKCDVCNEYIEMRRDVRAPFSDWAYGCVEWSDFEEDVHELSNPHWVRSEVTPKVSECRTVFVQKPFEENIGNEFWVLYEPALLYYNGWNDYPEEEIRKCAIVRCRFEKVLSSNEYGAWIKVNVQEVVYLHDLYQYYDNTKAEEPIDIFKGIPKADYNIDFENNRWYVISWTAQGDCGEIRWIYKDENDVRHLVMKRWYAFDEDVLYIGNICGNLSSE